MYRVHRNQAFWFTTLQFQSQPRETDQCMNIGYAEFSQGPYITMVPWCYFVKFYNRMYKGNGALIYRKSLREH